MIHYYALSYTLGYTLIHDHTISSGAGVDNWSHSGAGVGFWSNSGIGDYYDT